MKMLESNIPDSKMYAGKIKRLAIALMNHGYSFDDAIDFISSAKGIDDKNKKGMAEWFNESLPKLAERADYKKICEECACCLGGKRFEEARKIFLEETTLDKRIKRLLKTPYIIGCRGEIIDDANFIVNFFPELDFYRCPCLKFDKGKQEHVMQEGYCFCCCGHLKHHIEKALGTTVEVELLSSSLTSLGKSPCKFLVKVK